MAWTVPKTWGANELLSSSDMNTYVKNQLLFLHDNRSNVLPVAGLQPQDEWTYQADDGAGILWKLKYDSGNPAGLRWEFCGGNPLRSHLASLSSTGSTSYVATGAAVTVPLGGEYWFEYGHNSSGSGVGQDILTAPSYAGAAASDADAAGTAGPGTVTQMSAFSVSPLKVLSASAAVALHHRSPDGVGVAMHNVRLLAHPVRVN